MTTAWGSRFNRAGWAPPGMLPASAAAAAAEPVDLAIPDFDTANGGGALSEEAMALIGQEFTVSGLRITVHPAGTGSTPGLFNADCVGPTGANACSGNDGGLATGARYGAEPQGLVLIINGSENGLNDDPSGGSVAFEFTDPGGVDFFSDALLDIEEEEPLTAPDILFSFMLADGTELAETSVGTLAAAFASTTIRALAVESLTGPPVSRPATTRSAATASTIARIMTR